MIEGVISWDPPADEASVLHYAVWVSHEKDFQGREGGVQGGGGGGLCNPCFPIILPTTPSKLP